MYVSLPQGGTMLVLNIDDLTKVNNTLNLHTIPNSSRRLSQQTRQPTNPPKNKKLNNKSENISKKVCEIK